MKLTRIVDRPACFVFLGAVVLSGCAAEDADHPVTSDAGDDASATDTRALPGDVASTDTATGADVAGEATTPVDTGPISADCKTYCDCFMTNCASIQAIPGGLTCPQFCAGFTHDQWSCRNNHCQLVVPEKNPGHCMHAVGIDQCM